MVVIRAIYIRLMTVGYIERVPRSSDRQVLFFFCGYMLAASINVDGHKIVYYNRHVSDSYWLARIVHNNESNGATSWFQKFFPGEKEEKSSFCRSASSSWSSCGNKMDQINKVGSYWLGQKANKQFDSVGNDLNVRLLHFSIFSRISFICYLILPSFLHSSNRMLVIPIICGCTIVEVICR